MADTRWPQPINIYDERTAYVDLSYFDTVPAELWTEPGDYGDSRRKRFKPDTLSVYWRKGRDDAGWKTRTIRVSGRYLHKRAWFDIQVRYVADLQDGRPVEDWMVPLIEATRPKEGAHG